MIYESANNNQVIVKEPRTDLAAIKEAYEDFENYRHGRPYIDFTIGDFMERAAITMLRADDHHSRV